MYTCRWFQMPKVTQQRIQGPSSQTALPQIMRSDGCRELKNPRARIPINEPKGAFGFASTKKPQPLAMCTCLKDTRIHDVQLHPKAEKHRSISSCLLRLASHCNGTVLLLCLDMFGWQGWMAWPYVILEQSQIIMAL